jgi:uncharacterized protein YdeI (YjbR/CyaY-like superfamily)
VKNKNDVFSTKGSRNDIKLFLGFIDLIMFHNWVLGLDYQSI